MDKFIYFNDKTRNFDENVNNQRKGFPKTISCSKNKKVN